MATLRSTWWLLGTAILVPSTLSLVIGLAVGPGDVIADGVLITQLTITQGASVGIVPLLVAFIASLFGLFCFGHEYRHGMIRATLTAVPRRENVLVAKVVMTSLFAAGVSLASMLVALLWAALLLPSNAPIGTWEVWNVILGVVLYSTMFSVVALALAAIFRNQIAALVFMFIVPTVFEQVIRAILVVPERFNGIQGAAKYLPFDAGGSMYSRLALGDALEIFGYEPLGPVGGGIVMGVFTALLLGLAGVLFLRRDI